MNSNETSLKSVIKRLILHCYDTNLSTYICILKFQKVWIFVLWIGIERELNLVLLGLILFKFNDLMTPIFGSYIHLEIYELLFWVELNCPQKIDLNLLTFACLSIFQIPKLSDLTISTRKWNFYVPLQLLPYLIFYFKKHYNTL